MRVSIIKSLIQVHGNLAKCKINSLLMWIEQNVLCLNYPVLRFISTLPEVLLSEHREFLVVCRGGPSVQVCFKHCSLEICLMTLLGHQYARCCGFEWSFRQIAWVILSMQRWSASLIHVAAKRGHWLFDIYECFLRDFWFVYATLQFYGKEHWPQGQMTYGFIMDSSEKGVFETSFKAMTLLLCLSSFLLNNSQLKHARNKFYKYTFYFFFSVSFIIIEFIKRPSYEWNNYVRISFI